MSINEYHFVTEWQFSYPIEQVFKLIDNGGDFPRWWPEVYLTAQVETTGRADRIGDKIHFYTKGWLPYTLRWTAELVRIQPPNYLEIKASGDLVGRGIWTLQPHGNNGTYVRFDWHIVAEKPLLRYFSFIAKPIFSGNHRWAMARGFERFNQELARLNSTP